MIVFETQLVEYKKETGNDPFCWTNCSSVSTDGGREGGGAGEEGDDVGSLIALKVLYVTVKKNRKKKKRLFTFTKSLLMNTFLSFYMQYIVRPLKAPKTFTLGL